jgi:hypothetical protein
MTARRTPLREQASAVDRAAMNQRGFVEVLRDLVSRGKRPAAELEAATSWLSALEDAASTMREIADRAS